MQSAKCLNEVHVLFFCMSLKSYGEKGKIDGCPQSWSETWELIHYQSTSLFPITDHSKIVDQSMCNVQKHNIQENLQKICFVKCLRKTMRCN